MITREILSDLIGFSPEPYLTTTLYLRIEGSIKPNYVIELKELIKQRKKEVESQPVSPESRKSALSDLRKIQDFVTLKFTREGIQTLVIASCSAKKWWRVLSLNLPLKSRLIISSRPHYTPMALAMEEHSRFLVVLIERSRARLFEVFAGEIVEHTSILDEVPGKVKMGGFGGYEERRIERHIGDHVRRHYRHVGEAAYHLFKEHSCEYILLAGSEPNTGEFRHYLHSTLQDRIAASLHDEIHTLQAVVLEKTMDVEKALRQREETKLLDQFFNQVNSGGLGILGLDSTMRALQNGQVNYLLVQDGFREAGFRCAQCGGLLTTGGACTYCDGPTHPVGDLVEETVEEALQQGCQVKHITIPDRRLTGAGRIGATLRFRTKE